MTKKNCLCNTLFPNLDILEASTYWPTYKEWEKTKGQFEIPAPSFESMPSPWQVSASAPANFDSRGNGVVRLSSIIMPKHRHQAAGVRCPRGWPVASCCLEMAPAQHADTPNPMVTMLPSSASQDLYPENTTTNYRFELPSCVVMNNRDFEVGLTSFTFPYILLGQGHLATTDEDG